MTDTIKLLLTWCMPIAHSIWDLFLLRFTNRNLLRSFIFLPNFPDFPALFPFSLCYRYDDIDVEYSMSSLRLSFENDIVADLYRHWNLYDSLGHSLYTATQFKIWSLKGKSRFHEFLAVMGWVRFILYFSLHSVDSTITVLCLRSDGSSPHHLQPLVIILCLSVSNFVLRLATTLNRSCGLPWFLMSSKSWEYIFYVWLK